MVNFQCMDHYSMEDLLRIMELLRAPEEMCIRDRLEGERTALSARRDLLAAERATHRRLAQRELDRRFAQAREELEAARSQLATLEGETAKYGPLPDKDLLKKAQGELQYLKVLDEELRQGEACLLYTSRCVYETGTPCGRPL